MSGLGFRGTSKDWHPDSGGNETTSLPPCGDVSSYSIRDEMRTICVANESLEQLRVARRLDVLNRCRARRGSYEYRRLRYTISCRTTMVFQCENAVEGDGNVYL